MDVVYFHRDLKAWSYIRLALSLCNSNPFEAIGHESVTWLAVASRDKFMEIKSKIDWWLNRWYYSILSQSKSDKYSQTTPVLLLSQIVSHLRVATICSKIRSSCYGWYPLCGIDHELDFKIKN